MRLREAAKRQHPDFPWLDPAQPEGIERYLRRVGWLEPDEVMTTVERAGEGNMNLTLRIRSDRRSFVLKQARPWVEKYDEIAAPWDRSLVEARFYQAVQSLPEVAARMPRLLASDASARTLALEDLGMALDFSDLYGGAVIENAHIEELACYAAALHTGTRGRRLEALANREMRRLNHEHIFVLPLMADNGLDLAAFEPELRSSADALARDADFCRAVELTGRRYLADGPCLVHGDYFPGSWLHGRLGADGGPSLRVIDPEFGFYGDPELDLGVAVAHLALARQGPGPAQRLLERYDHHSDQALDPAWTARYASIEIVRRLIGVAQLPIAEGVGGPRFRTQLLARAARAMRSASLEPLWSGSD